MVPLPPLDSPKPSFAPRRPSVARRNARGPQGRLVLQGYTLDRSGAFRSGELPLCTGWPRTVMRGKPRKVNSGPYSVPKANRRTEPSPRNPPFRRATEGSRVLRKGRGVKRGRETLVSLPLLSPPGDPGIPGRRRRPLHTLTLGVTSPPPAAPLYRRKVYRQQTVKTARPPERRQVSPLPRGKSFLFFLLTALCYCIIIIVQHNKKGLRLCSGSFVGIARSTSRSWKS